MNYTLPPEQQLIDLTVVSKDHISQGKELIGGLLCCSVFEIYLTALGNHFSLEYRNKNELLEDLVKHISPPERDLLDKIRTKRNDVIHANSMKGSGNTRISAQLLADCRQLVTLCESFFLQQEAEDDEVVADSFFRLFPETWIRPEGELPVEIKEDYFADLMLAQKAYMQPLAYHLQRHFLDKLEGNNPRKLRFHDLSRVNRSSGYVWMSAVPALDGRRARVYLPGLTVLFTPHEIAVYLELPGKSHDYKRHYYEQFLQRGKIKDFLAIPTVKRRNFEFFHTWWYATREPLGPAKEYMNNRSQKRKEWRITEKTDEVLHDLSAGKDIFTRNFFLIGKGYSREKVLNSDLRFCLHEEIVADLTALHILQKDLLDGAAGL